jgi:hypothetical protein
MTDEERNAWILIRSYIDERRKVSLNLHIFNAVAILDKVFNTTKDNTDRKIEHVCGLQGFGRGPAGTFDICTACEQRK